MNKHPHIPIQPVRSSNVSGIGYDHATRTLAVQFANGGHYHFADVPREKFDALLKSDSKGSFFAKEIRGKFTSTNLHAKPKP